jgi:hypothetical protein
MNYYDNDYWKGMRRHSWRRKRSEVLGPWSIIGLWHKRGTTWIPNLDVTITSV